MKLPRGLIVSCQAREGNPLRSPEHMAAMARAAELAGAIAIRASGKEDIEAIGPVTNLPVIGLDKWDRVCFAVYITPNFETAQRVVDAGADIVAIDATDRPHPDNSVAELIHRIKIELDRPVMADISNRAEGVAAAAAGADYIATTLSGYTGGPVPVKPDLELVENLSSILDRPVIAEGRFATPMQAKAALDAGAHAVVVGTAITNPMAIASRFVEAIGRCI